LNENGALVPTLLLLSMGLGCLGSLAAGLLLVGMGVVESLSVLLALLTHSARSWDTAPTTFLNELILSKMHSTILGTLTGISMTIADVVVGLAIGTLEPQNSLLHSRNTGHSNILYTLKQPRHTTCQEARHPLRPNHFDGFL